MIVVVESGVQSQNLSKLDKFPPPPTQIFSKFIDKNVILETRQLTIHDIASQKTIPG